MIEFECGEQRTAVVAVKNTALFETSYIAKLMVGCDANHLAESSFMLGPGESAGLDFLIAMPLRPGSYPVYFDIYSSGEILRHYKTVEELLIIESNDTSNLESEL